METRHVKLNYEEALSAKKQLLSSELNLLHIMKILTNYKLLRKRELQIKNKLKNTSSSLKIKLNSIESSFPTEEEKPTKRKMSRISKIEKEKKGSIQKEVQEIKKKLEKLK